MRKTKENHILALTICGTQYVRANRRIVPVIYRLARISYFVNNTQIVR